MQYMQVIYFVELFRKKRIKEKKTKMKKYTLGYKCFSFAYAYDNVIFILEFLMTCQEIYI